MLQLPWSGNFPQSVQADWKSHHTNKLLWIGEKKRMGAYIFRSFFLLVTKKLKKQFLREVGRKKPPKFKLVSNLDMAMTTKGGISKDKIS